jgi:hypothetical protein
MIDTSFWAAGFALVLLRDAASLLSDGQCCCTEENESYGSKE